MPRHPLRVHKASLDDLVRYANQEWERMSREASAAPSDRHEGERDIPAKRPCKIVTDANGTRALRIEEGDPVPKLAVVFIIDDDDNGSHVYPHAS